VGSIITVPVINVYSIADQQLIFNAFSQVRFISSFKMMEKDISII
jgi:hypothetical protein